MVTPTSHFFAFHWLCCLLPIGYWPKPDSVGVRICHYHWIQPHPPFRWFSDIFDRMHLFSISIVITAPVGKETFRQSPCWYYPWTDIAVSTSSDTQHLWTWWHVLSIYLLTTSVVFTPAGHVNILQVISKQILAFSFPLEVLFVPLTSFIGCYDNLNCLSFTEIMSFLIWSSMYSSCSFWYVLLCFHCTFLKFWTLAFAGILLSSKYDFFSR